MISPDKANFSRSGVSISYSMKLDDRLPRIESVLCEKTLDSLKQAADEAIEYVKPITPRKSGQLADTAYSAVYRQGNMMGNVRITWPATSNTSKKWPNFHYGIAQNNGGTSMTSYVKYTTPGTGPHFMDEAWKYIYDNVQRILIKEKLLED